MSRDDVEDENSRSCRRDLRSERLFERMTEEVKGEDNSHVASNSSLVRTIPVSTSSFAERRAVSEEALPLDVLVRLAGLVGLTRELGPVVEAPFVLGMGLLREVAVVGVEG